MPELLDYKTMPGKDARFHLDLMRKMLTQVGDNKPTQRRFALWLRDAGIADKGFLNFVVRVLDVKIGERAELGEVGQELYEVAKRPAPRPTMVVAGPGQAPQAPPAPPPDPFKKALFERFVELTGYLCKHVYSELADAGGFLSEAEIWQRIQRTGYRGERPTKGQFEAWLKWMKFLGHVQQVGFRLKHTEEGVDGLGYLRSLSDEDLLGGQGAMGLLSGLGDDEPADGGGAAAAAPPGKLFYTAEELAAASGSAPVEAPVLPEAPVGRSSGRRGGRADDDDLDDDDAGDVDFGPAHGGGAAGRDDDDDGDDHGGLRAPPERDRAEPDPGKPLSEDEADAIRELFGDDAVEALAPPTGLDGAALGAQLAALDAELDAIGRDLESGPADAGSVDAADRGDVGRGASAASEADASEAAASEAEGEAEGEPESVGDDEGAGAEPDDAAQALAASTASAPEASSQPGGAATAEADDEPRPAPRGAPRASTERAGGASPGAAAMPPAAEAPPPGARAPVAASSASGGRARSPAPAPASAVAPASAAVAPAATAAPVDGRGAERILAALWECAPGRRPICARGLGLERAGAKALGYDLFRLAVAATLLEGGGPSAEKVALFRKLAASKALEDVFFRDGTLDRVLDALGFTSPETPLPEAAERLIHLPRLRRTLGSTEVARALAALAPEERPARLVELSGGAFGQGAYWIAREMAHLGHW